MRKSRKKLILKLVGATAVLALILLGVNKIYSSRLDELKENLTRMTGRLNDYEISTKTVVCAATDIRAGDRLSSANLKTVELPEQAIPEDVCLSVSGAEGIARISLTAGTYITKKMLADRLPEADVRELEFAGVHFYNGIQPGDNLDIRIIYPDGTDYVVLSKKTVFGIDEEKETLLLHVGEEELLLMDSAMVDVYLYEGAGLYATGYIESELQMASQVNYVPSAQASELILNNPNIKVVASEYLRTEERSILERRMSKNEED